jgi:hypothetical protein
LGHRKPSTTPISLGNWGYFCEFYSSLFIPLLIPGMNKNREEYMGDTELWGAGLLPHLEFCI